MNIKAAYIEISNTARDLIEKNGLDYNAAIREAGELYKKKTSLEVPVQEKHNIKCPLCGYLIKPTKL